MKKLLIPVLLVLAAVSCQRENNVCRDIVDITVTAGIPGTRSFIENDGTAWIPFWNKDDVLGVMVDEAYDKPHGLKNTSEDGRTATFAGTLDNAEDGEHVLTAWYPKGLKAGRSGSVLKYVLAEEQTLPSLTSFDPSMDLLVGMPETFTVAEGKANVDGMRFRRVFTVVKVTLKDESTKLAGRKVSRVALTAASTLTGKANVEITTGDITRWENPSSTVAGNYSGTDFTIDGIHSAFLLVNPAILAAGSSLTVNVTTDDAALVISKSVTLPKEVVFAENKVTTLTFTLSDENVQDSGQPVNPGENAELECPDPPQTGTVEMDRLYGYATGVTGGDAATSANILHFDNGKALQTWLLARTRTEKAGDHSPVTIWLSGTFGPEDGRDFSEAHPWFDIKDVSNLSFYGTDGFVMDRIGIFCVRASNIIIRNINFRQPKADNGADAVSMQDCDGVWVDHCTFTSLNQTKDYEDGSCDITHESKNVTVSWCRFIKTQKSCLVGHSNSASADAAITATFHHNWFDQSSSRHPRVRYGKAHVYNNLFDGCTTYGVGSAYGAKVLVEYNYFDGVQLPTDICTYPAKESGESNLQGSVAGYLYATQDVLVNRPAKAKDPYPLTNVQYKSYNGETITPLTYADFKPAYSYVVTPAEDVPEVVRGGAGYGKLGWAEAPVAVNNGGITDFNGTGDDPTDPDPDDPDQPEVPAGAHTYVIYMNDSASVVSTMDGTSGSTYFTHSTAAADFRNPASDKYNGPFTIDGTTYQRGFKMDSGGYITFTTSGTLNSAVRFYFARRKEADTAAQMQLIPAGGTATVFDTPFDAYADSGVIALEKGTEYTIKQKTKEQAVILVIVTESE
jgi:pectate lyase